MSEPSALCFSVRLGQSGYEAWWNDTVFPPESWNDWEGLQTQASDFLRWRQVGQVRVGSLLNEMFRSGRRDGSLLERHDDGRIEIVALLAAENWHEQLMLLGAVRMLERQGAKDGWALMHDYVFERSGTAWALRFPFHGGSEVFADAPKDIRTAADALALPFLETRRGSPW
ncbi:MAG: hypothetical protein AAGF15_04345 [Pseudomonadota bacterium]